MKYDKEDENLLIAGGWDLTVKVWDLRAGQVIRSIYGPYISGDALDIHDGYILTGSWRESEQLQLWDFGTCEFIEEIDWNNGLASSSACSIYGAQFQKSTGDLIIAGGSGSNEVKIFDGNTLFKPCAQIRDLSRATYTVDFSNSGDTFAMGGGDGVVRVFNVVNEV